MKQYAEVINTGESYTTHTNARQYGCTNYHHWLSKYGAKNGDILEIVKEILVNTDDPSYILKDNEGVEYIIGKSGVELLINYKPVMKYTKQDWIDGKCAIKWEDKKKSKINEFFQECTESNSKAEGMGVYYYSSNNKGYFSHSQTTTLPIVTIDELLNNKEMSKVEAPKPFLVKGDSKHLLKACYEEIIALGYTEASRKIKDVSTFFSTNISKLDSLTRLEEYTELFVNGTLSIDPEYLVFILPQDYNKAIEYAKEAINSSYWTQNRVKKMTFGTLEVEVEKAKGYVMIAEGKVTKAALKEVVDYIKNKPKLLGYTLSDNGTEINFGCKSGTVYQLIDIYNEM